MQDMCAVQVIISNAFTIMWLLHNLSTRDQSSITDSIKLANLAAVSMHIACPCAEELDIFLSFCYS